MGNWPVKLDELVASRAIGSVLRDLSQKVEDLVESGSRKLESPDFVHTAFREAEISVQHIISLTTVGINEEDSK